MFEVKKEYRIQHKKTPGSKDLTLHFLHERISAEGNCVYYFFGNPETVIVSYDNGKTFRTNRENERVYIQPTI